MNVYLLMQKTPDPHYCLVLLFSEIALLRPHAKHNLSFLTQAMFPVLIKMLKLNFVNMSHSYQLIVGSYHLPILIGCVYWLYFKEV
jgi:hypothetical protein